MLATIDAYQFISSPFSIFNFHSFLPVETLVEMQYRYRATVTTTIQTHTARVVVRILMN